ncbi:unnamed protein product [Somion occarium]|uniref:UBR-type domain-containing protein n=2 Tax=Somion occarium TaxID=3059160 RepID=A0ABP1DSY3_9APHY
MPSSTIAEILASQSALVQEASEAVPFQFSQCTYSRGYIKQAVYWCVTCKETRGVCSACSVACHTDHEQVELFPKRHFRCDCPTSAMPHPCTLHHQVEDVNTENTYGQNFKGQFCRCGRPYDPQVEKETMIQCLACEDWFHESCLNLRDRPSSREPTPAPTDHADQNASEEHDDARSDASSYGLPPPLITASMYESLVCGACVRDIAILKRWAGTPGILMVVRDGTNDKWKVIGQDSESAETLDVNGGHNELPPVVVGQKRGRSGSVGDDPKTKRPREVAESSSTLAEPRQGPPCLAPCPSSYVQRIFSSAQSPVAVHESSELGSGDIFLTQGFRERWCQCTQCLTSLHLHPYLLEEEETYEPPEDPDSGLSLEELGMRALQRLPRDKAIDGIRAFNEMRDQLMNHLRPFAQEGREVTEADIKAFFEEKMAARGSG